MSASQADVIAAELVAVSRAELKEELRRLEACVGRLTLEQLWERRHDAENSVGNLLLHLRGNVRQWLVCGVGGQPDDRDRDAEFTQREPIPAADLLEPLRHTLAEADAVLATLSTSDLLASRRIQDHDVTILHAIYHVVEHFSGHVGQVIWATKRATGEDLGFYRHLDAKKAEA